jgi:group I intron endonuclease
MNMSGIYQIKSKAKPKRIYIGSSINIDTRWKRHLYDLAKNKHRSAKLQNHYNKYGKSDLVFSVLISCDKNEALEKEQFFIDSYNPWFNSAKVAGAPMLGRNHSEETKQRLSKMKTGIKMSEEFKERDRVIQLGKKQSAETIAKRVAKNTGKKRTEELKMRMRNPSEETRRKLSESNKGKIPWNKGKKGLSSSWNKGIPAWNRGKSPSEEQKRKRRETMMLKRYALIPHNLFDQKN